MAPEEAVEICKCLTYFFFFVDFFAFFAAFFFVAITVTSLPTAD
jgi:hypothetical protein